MFVGFLLVIRGSPPTTHLLVTTNHLLTGFLAVICGFLTIHSQSFPTGHSLVTANHSFAGYCQPIVRRLSAGHSWAIADHSITGFPLVIPHHSWAITYHSAGFLPVIRHRSWATADHTINNGSSLPASRRFLPTIRSRLQVFYLSN